MLRTTLLALVLTLWPETALAQSPTIYYPTLDIAARLPLGQQPQTRCARDWLDNDRQVCKTSEPPDFDPAETACEWSEADGLVYSKCVAQYPSYHLSHCSWQQDFANSLRTSWRANCSQMSYGNNAPFYCDVAVAYDRASWRCKKIVGESWYGSLGP